MFGRARTARTSASISGSDIGWSPEPVTDVSHPAGKLRFMSRPSGLRGVGTVKPSQSVIVPSASSRYRAAPRGAAAWSTGIISRASSGCSTHAPFGSAMRIVRIRPSPSTSWVSRPGQACLSVHGQGRMLLRRYRGESASAASTPSGLTRGAT